MSTRLTSDERHARARERTIDLMAEAARAGDYLEALYWLNTIATVDLDFSLTADDILASWRRRASLLRTGSRVVEPSVPPAADHRGLFAALLEQAHDGIVISDRRDGWMLECSRSFAALAGYPREELLGRTSVELELIEPVVRADAVETTLAERSTGGIRTKLRRKDGVVREIEFSVQLLPGDELLLSIVRDVTPPTAARPVGAGS